MHSLAPNAVLALAFLVLASGTLAGSEDSQQLLREASEAIDAGKSQKAVQLLTKAIQDNDKLAIAYYLRGRENFRLAKFAESVRDFDDYVKQRPDLESRQWERGIAMYYARQFDRGANQFKMYQTYHDNDVENATWRFLCMARTVGVEKARKELLPIKNDRRVPMMQIYEMYRGKLQAEDVLKATSADAPDDDRLNQRLFYAHLYIGLLREAEGQNDQAKRHILKAKGHRIGHYMWDVANVHAQQFSP